MINLEEIELEMIERQRRGQAHFGDAGALLVIMERLADDAGEGISWVEMTLELDPGTFERLDEIALKERYPSWVRRGEPFLEELEVDQGS